VIYTALGDSFTAGIDESVERWPDLVARALGDDVVYENLAEVGATSADVEDGQLPRALGLRPDLVSIVCGANDVLETVRPDPEAFSLRLRRMLARVRCACPNAAIVTATYPDLSRFLPLRPRTRARVEEGMLAFNEAIRDVAGRHRAILLEGAGHPDAERRDAFADDGFHPSGEGHRRAAAVVLAALRERLDIQTRDTEEVA
jgi:lysophospholipase L1-like esterase